MGVALAALFAWLIHSLASLGPRDGPRESPLAQSLSKGERIKDTFAEKARAYVETVSRDMSRGEVYGTIDGTTRKLTLDEVERMRQVEAIRQELRNLRNAYASLVKLREIAATNSRVDFKAAESRFIEAKGRTLAELKKFPADIARTEISSFTGQLGSDPGANALFKEVADALS